MIAFSPLFADEVAPQGMTPKPVDLFTIFGLGINGSIIAETIAVIILVVFVQVAMRSPKLIPTGAQNFVEWLIELLSNFIESLTGRATMQRGFWFFGGLFIFVFLENFIALLPGVGTIGYGHMENGHFEVTHPFLRGANANINMTAAYTAIFFFMFFYWCIRQSGIWGSLHHIFGSKVKFENPAINFAFIVIFFLVGWIEVLSILFIRPVAFPFRLFGNIYGGEFLLDTIYKMWPSGAFITLIPFYFYELMVAFIQAFVFLALTAAFTGIITNSPDHSSEGKDAH